MATILGVRRVVVSASVALNSTGDKFTLTPGQPIDILKWGFIADGLVDVGAGLVVALDHRPTAGADTDRTEEDTITVSDDVPAGEGVYTDLIGSAPAATALSGEGVEAPSRQEAGPLPLQVDPGEEAVFEVTDAADTAGDGFFFVEFLEHPIAGSRIANLTKIND